MRALLALPLLLLGALTAVATVAVHGRWWGLALACGAVLATEVAVGPGWATRLAFAGGFVPVVVRLAVARPEGDFVIGADAAGYALLVLTVVVAVLAAATLPRPGSGRSGERAGRET